ncbi:phage portal protein [Promicromonospora thailandica]|uniref:Phage portal protein, HK97 family n=1 Tax=Promicromonospora thailandica TaxID=765201 RepID=A0A9X2G4G4_9MICO|nr:phage portal protein [Promicromonospora thailandica]MCP2265565.1 phage portal protein, HK97 family [Promicromonospora thailandica]
MKALQALAGMVARSIENPANPVSWSSASASATDLWGSEQTSGDPMRIAAALRCVEILASGVAGCPLNVTKRDDHTEVHIDALEQNVSGGVTTPFEMWETVVAHQATRGNAFVRKVRTRDGRLTSLVPIHPDRVEVKVADGALVGMPWVKKFVIDGKQDSALTTHEIMHIPGLSMDGVRGISKIENLRRTFQVAQTAEDVAARMFEDGLMQSGFLYTDKAVNEEQSQILRARWRAKTGASNAGDIVILDNGAKFDRLPLSPSDAQFLESRKFSTSEIARIFGLPGWIINDQEKSTSWGTGMEQQFISFVVLALKPYFHRIEQRVTREICDPKTEKAEFKIEGLLRGDSTARAAFYASGIQHGWMVPNEPRELEDLPPVPWGNEPYRPYNESAASQGAADPSTTGGNDDEDDDDA